MCNSHQSKHEFMGAEVFLSGKAFFYCWLAEGNAASITVNAASITVKLTKITDSA